MCACVCVCVCVCMCMCVYVCVAQDINFYPIDIKSGTQVGLVKIPLGGTPEKQNSLNFSITGPILDFKVLLDRAKTLSLGLENPFFNICDKFRDF